MIEPVKKTIDGHEYEIAPFLGMHGWRLQMRLSKLVGPSIRDGLAALSGKGVQNLMEAEIDVSALGGALAGFMDAIAVNDPRGELLAELLSQTQRDGRLLTENNINEVYAANYAEMIKAVVAVVNANNFFGIASFGLASGLEKMAASNPES